MSDAKMFAIEMKAKASHKYYPKLLITNNCREQVKVRSFFDPKCGLWKVVINYRKK